MMRIARTRLDMSLRIVAEQDVDRITSHDGSNLLCDPLAHSPLVFSTVEEIVANLVREEGDAVFSRQYRYTKRALDLLVATLGLIILSPLLLGIALIIILDSEGPAFFIQERVGYRGRLLRMVKFRSMTQGSSVQIMEGTHKRQNDNRVTRVGRVLRKTSLDELPNLVNVFRGEMSLVGPRPEITTIALQSYERWQYRRLLVPQGMTGWWQVTGRATKILREHTADDLYYIAHASFWFDLKILIKTVHVVCLRDGAF